MKTKVDICNKEWCNLIFEGKNKEYGAYSIRTQANTQKIKSLFITLSLAISILMYPILTKKAPVDLFKVTAFEPTKLSDPPIEVPKELIKPKLPELPKLSKAIIGFLKPEITNTDVTSEVPTQESMKDPRIGIGPATILGDPNGDPSDFIGKNLTGDIDKNKVFINVEKMPQFPGGLEALRKFLKKNLRYPDVSQENGISGNVYIQFVVDKTGEIRDMKVVRGLDNSCNEEAIRVLKLMPRWTAGMQNDIPVSVLFTLPITYQLNKS